MSQLVPEYSPSYWNEMENDFRTFYVDDPIAKYSDFPLDGLNCGVPTITTPTMTVTPTSFREFEKTISDSHQNEAGFVPPLVQPPISTMINSSTNASAPTNISNNVGGGYTVSFADVRHWHGGSTVMPDLPPLINLNSIQTISAAASSPPIPTHVISMGQGGGSSGSSNSSSPSSSSSSGRSRKNAGGRRPNKTNGVISPEEEEKKQLRRDRNKKAAAKCREKRMKLIKDLEEAVRSLQEEKNELNQMVHNLQQEKENLEEELEIHLPTCCLNGRESPEDIKPFINSDDYNMNMTMAATEKSFLSANNDQQSRIFTPINGISLNSEMEILPTSTVVSSSSSIFVKRPSYLPVSNFYPAKNHKVNVTEVNGIPITTPSTEFVNALISGESTGLTPIAAMFGPSCSTQLRNTNTMDLASPDSIRSELVSL